MVISHSVKWSFLSFTFSVQFLGENVEFFKMYLNIVKKINYAINSTVESINTQWCVHFQIVISTKWD